MQMYLTMTSPMLWNMTNVSDYDITLSLNYDFTLIDEFNGVNIYYDTFYLTTEGTAVKVDDVRKKTMLV